MPFSSGSFSLYSPGNPVVTGTTISSTWANNTLTDIATGLSTCVLKNGSQTITANIPMSSFKFTGLGAGSAAGDSLRYEQLWTGANLTIAATQAQQESATSNGAAVTPGTQQYHPSAPKVWGRVTYSAGSPTLAQGYNVASLTDTALGRLTVNFTTAFSSATYATIVGGEYDAGNTNIVGNRYGDVAQQVGSVEISWSDLAAGLVDPREGSFVCFGDQ